MMDSTRGEPKMTTLRALLAAGILATSFGVAIAKLPAPPPLDQKGKAEAEEKKAKDAVLAEAVKAQQAKAEDRVVARYTAEQKARGKAVTPQLVPAVLTESANAKAIPAAAKGAPAASAAKK